MASSSPRSVTIEGAGTSLSFDLATHMYEAIDYQTLKPLAPTLPDAPKSPSRPIIAGNGYRGNQVGRGGLIKPTHVLALPSIEDGEEEDGIPVSHETEKIAAWKIAKLSADKNSLVLRAANGIDVHVDDTAICNAGCNHKSPQLDCSCGFYAYRSIKELNKFGVIKSYGHKNSGQVLLSVELGGKVIEHERLLRAERQIINTLWLPGDCADCDEPAEVCMFLNTYPTSLCAEHAEENKGGVLMQSPMLTLSDLSNMVGTDVRFFMQPGW